MMVWAVSLSFDSGGRDATPAAPHRVAEGRGVLVDHHHVAAQGGRAAGAARSGGGGFHSGEGEGEEGNGDGVLAPLAGVGDELDKILEGGHGGAAHASHAAGAALEAELLRLGTVQGLGLL